MDVDIISSNNLFDIMFPMPVNRPYSGKNDQKFTIFTLASFLERIFKYEIKDFWRKLIYTFC